MNTPQKIAKHFREVYFGGNWTASCVQQQMEDVDLSEALQEVYDLNSIARLFCHLHYYTHVVLKVLQGGRLEAKDEVSFHVPEFKSSKEWEAWKQEAWKEAEAFATAVELLSEDKLNEFFCEEKYGIYYRNLHGIIEHSHYHLGQIALLKKILRHHHGETPDGL